MKTFWNSKKLACFLTFIQQVSGLPGIRYMRDPSTVIFKQTRPIMYTFFELKENKNHMKVDHDPFEDLLSVWVDLWSQAGWEPRILTLEDAKRHPNYDLYSKAITKEDGNLYEGGYEHMCFMRWLAMAAHGNGGWMCDNDLFPMGITVEEGLTLPNEGQFTSFDRHVPSLMSGSAEEWNRMSSLVLEFGIQQTQYIEDNSDMFALLHIKNNDPNAYISHHVVYNGFPYRERNVMNCEGIRKFFVVHVSHKGTAEAIENKLVNYSGGSDVAKYIDILRPSLVRGLEMNWKQQCLIHEIEPMF